MKNICYAMSVAMILMLNACGDSTTTSTSNATKGEIYGYARVSNEYDIKLTDQSGLNAQLMEDGKVIQSVTTIQDGLFSFKDVLAGVYSIRFFKNGYVCTGLSGLPDTAIHTNIQFVGKGSFKLEDKTNYYQFASSAEADSSFWVLKPDISYEIIKDIKVINDIWRKDTIIKTKINPNGGNDSANLSVKQVSLYGSGTKETVKIRFTVEYESALPFAEMKRAVVLSIQDDDRTYTNSVTFASDANALSGVYEYTSPNVIVKDSLGKTVNHIERPGSRTDIRVKKIAVQASSKIPNSVTHRNDPMKVTMSKKVTVSLLD